jgi:diguanylate cyclase (GGDEF)-like protein
MKVTSAAVLEPSAPERKRLLAGLRKAGLKAGAVAEVEDLAREQVVVLGPTVPRPASVARQLRRLRPAVLVLQAQRKVDLARGAHADGIVPLPLSPADLRVRLPELWRLRERPVRRGPGREGRSPQARAGEGILDPLTAFYTFAHFKEVLFVEVKRARRYGFPISVAMIAFDPLPGSAGLAGDLRERLHGGLALAIRRSLRDTDYPVQYTPDRVVVLMPHTDLQGALVVSRRICERVSRASLAHGDQVVRPTISVGVSTGTTRVREPSFADMAQKALEAMDRAMRAGGSRVEFADAADDLAAAEALAPQSG